MSARRKKADLASGLRGSLKIPRGHPAEAGTPATPEADTEGKGAAKRKKVRVTLYLSEELHEEARSAAMTLSQQGQHPNSLSALFDDALENELVKLRKKHNAGEPFPLWKGPLPGGRLRK